MFIIKFIVLIVLALLLDKILEPLYKKILVGDGRRQKKLFIILIGLFLLLLAEGLEFQNSEIIKGLVLAETVFASSYVNENCTE